MQPLISNRMARRRETRPMREPLPTVIGAGITEKWYFRHLKDLCGYKMEVKPKYFGSDTAYDMQKLVDNVLAMGGKAICVFDMDTTHWDAAEKERKEQFMKLYADNPDVILCDSMPSIEYWFLLHFEKTNKHFENSDKVIDVLEHYMPYEKKEKFLDNASWVKQLVSDDIMQTAINNARELGSSGASYTNIPKAILFLSDN